MKLKLALKLERILILISLLIISVHSIHNANILKSFRPLEPTTQPMIRNYELNLTRTPIAPDGFTKDALLINSLYPGTIIHANKGDRIYVTVRNLLGEPTTLHWHGIFQQRTSWYDGAVGQTQCPIPVNGVFVYDYFTHQQHGTYWYHGHVHGQYMEGLRAPLIIHDPADPYRTSYDEEYVVTLSDWYHGNITEMIGKRMAPGYGGFNPIPDSGLISGLGRYDCSKAPAGSNCQVGQLATYIFVPGRRYRLRVINTSGMAHFTFSIDNHPLTIIEADGEYSRQTVVNKLPIGIGQRYSVIVTANNTVNNYWIRATIDNSDAEGCLLRNPETINNESAINFNVLGIVRYQGAPDAVPTTTEFPGNPPLCKGLDPNLLKQITPKGAPGPVTNTFTFNFTIRPDENNVGRGFVNDSPYLISIFNPTIERVMTAKTPLNQIESTQNIYTYDNSSGVAEIIVLNSNRAAHPFHLHGHHFYVLGIGTGAVDRTSLNLVDPFPRDTLVMGGNSWAVIRFYTNNPGVWAFHCHIDWHVEMGMVIQFVALPSELAKMTIPAAVTNLCRTT